MKVGSGSLEGASFFFLSSFFFVGNIMNIGGRVVESVCWNEALNGDRILMNLWNFQRVCKM